ncbi:MAG: hypothetical protein H6512_09045 [Acidimicrobiia bacterium]|nr:hypothetical protein [Acidimicrobiia bacterium]
MAISIVVADDDGDSDESQYLRAQCKDPPTSFVVTVELETPDGVVSAN